MGSDSVASPSADLEPGTLVNGLYRLVRLLGVGGMGEVWEARHERTKGRVALKLLLSELGRHEQVLHRFQREVEITSGLNHPNIVRVSDADKLPSGRPFLVMEFLEGHDLSNVSRTGTALGLAETIEIIEQTAMGLQAAHGQSVVHRDLKPANLFVVPLPGTGRVVVKILDFGISKALDGLSQLTQSRSVMGTPHYMAPEQATGGASTADARADQFSLAAIAYELLTGRMAFAGDGLVNVIFKVVHEQPPSFASWGITMAPEIEATVMRGLRKSPPDRFGSVLEFSNELRRAAGQTGIAGRAHTAILPTLPTAPRTLPLPTPQPGTTEPPLTTLRASTGQLDVVSIGDTRSGLGGEAGIRTVNSSGGKARALIIGGAGLVAVVFVGSTLLRHPAPPSGQPSPAEPGGSTKAALASGAVVTPAAASRVAPAATPGPSPPVAVPPNVPIPKGEQPAGVEHVTIPATAPGPGVVERPSRLPIASPSPPPPPKKSSREKKPNDKRPPAATRTLSDSDDHKAPSHVAKPSGKKVGTPGGHAVPLNDDL